MRITLKTLLFLVAMLAAYLAGSRVAIVSQAEKMAPQRALEARIKELEESERMLNLKFTFQDSVAEACRSTVSREVWGEILQIAEEQTKAAFKAAKEEKRNAEEDAAMEKRRAAEAALGRE